MNNLTKDVLTAYICEHRKQAANYGNSDGNSDSLFRANVENLWWERVMVEHGIPRQERVFHLLRLFAPEHFDEEGYLLEGKIDIDIYVSGIVRCYLNDIADRPDVQFDPDWEAVPAILAAIEKRELAATTYQLSLL